MNDLQRENEEEIQPTIQVKHLPLLLRPKQTCELFGIDLKALHKLETSGRVKAVRIGPKKVQRRYSPVAVAKALGVDLMAENYTLLAGTSFTKEPGDRLADSSSGVLTKTREMIQAELHGLHQSIGELVSSELAKATPRRRCKPKAGSPALRIHIKRLQRLPPIPHLDPALRARLVSALQRPDLKPTTRAKIEAALKQPETDAPRDFRQLLPRRPSPGLPHRGQAP